MQKWQYAYMNFTTEREELEGVCMTDGSGKVETTYCPDEMTASEFFETTLAEMG